MNGSITSRMPRSEYDALIALNITRLKEMRRSPLHYQWAYEHPKESDSLTLGIATHVAVLEPERFLKDFAIWDRRLDNGRAAPRNGKVWDEFKDLHAERTILTGTEAETAQGIAKAVRFDETANKYLAAGDPEVTLWWGVNGQMRKGRVDWLTRLEGEPVIVGLKTARDCRHMLFAAQAARLGYHLQWAWYHDAFEHITGAPARMVEIVVESEPPHAVATYLIPRDIIDQGRDEYQAALDRLKECARSGHWPGPVEGEEYLTLPTWAYGREDEDIGDLGLENLNA